jgi:hypothetical protein
MIYTAVFAAALALGCSSLSFADHDSHARARDAQDYGYQYGYSNGYHHGVSDREHHNKLKPDVKDADNGYEKSMGSKDQYKEGYRSGFIAGYDDAVNNRPGRFSEVYGPSGQESARGSADRSADYSGWSATHVASDLGYRDGLAAGQSDYQQHRDARPEDQGDYRHADHGYRSDYGDKSVYQQQYRDSFIQGYNDAYSGRR